MTIYWIFFGSRTTGSSRIYGYNIHDYFIKHGYNSSVLFGPASYIQLYDLPWRNPERLLKYVQFQPGDAVVFETVRGPRAQKLARDLKAKQVKVVFSECDLYPESDLAGLSDTVVCSSDYLARVYEERHQKEIAVIAMPVEAILDEIEMNRRTHRTDRDLTLLWVGNAGHWQTLDDLRSVLEYSEFRDYRLVTVSNHPSADIKWSLDASMLAWRTADVVVVPTAKHPYALAKSSNRVVQAMALGAPVLAGRIPSYEKVIQPGENGFLCDTVEEWVLALRAMRDPEVRDGIAKNGWNVVQKEYTLDTIGPEWLEVLNGEVHRTSSRSKNLNPGQVKLPLTIRWEEFQEYSRRYEKKQQLGRSFLYRMFKLVLHPSFADIKRGYVLLRKIIAARLRISFNSKALRESSVSKTVK